MKMYVKLVLAAVSAVALCCAQSDPTPPTGTTPVAKVTVPEASAPPSTTATSPETPKSGPQVIEDAAPAAKTAGAQALESSKPEPGKSEQAKSAPAGPVDPRTAPYVIGPLDVLVIKVWNNQPLSGVYDVHQDGNVSIPLIGDVKADGLTTNQLKDVISKKLNECCIVTPEVSVEVGKIYSKHYFVYGEVGHAGEFPLQRATTVMDALADVGGFRDFANLKKIRILRELPGGKTEEHIFNYKEVSRGKNMQQNILLQSGDRIFIQ
jgi:polysaccharide export outer membrane protein